MFYPVYRSDSGAALLRLGMTAQPAWRQETDGRRLAAHPFFVAFTAFLVSL